MSSKLDYFLVKAVKDDWIVLDGDYVVVSDAGEKEMSVILAECMKIMEEVAPDITESVHELSRMTGSQKDSLTILKMMLLQLVGTEVALLTFLMHEKANNYIYLKETLKETTKPKPRLNLVRSDDDDNGNSGKYDA